jgi:glycosyltransferase involved in cell wall biosynthesis
MVGSNKPKIIWIVTNSNFPFGGASANYLRLLSKGLTAEYFQVKVIIQGGKSYGKEKTEKVRKSIFEGISYQYCGFINRPRSFFLKGVDDFLSIFIPVYLLFKSLFSKKPAHIFVYNSTSYKTLLFLLFCKIFKINTVKIIPEWYDKNSFGTGILSKFKWLDFIIGIKKLNKIYSQLIVLSTFLSSYYINRGVPASKILLIPNLVDFEKFENTQINQVPYKKVRIGYCGTPTAKDGINDLLKAFSIISESRDNVELLIVGDSPGGYSLLPNIKKLADSLNIREKIIYTGLVGNNEIPSYLKSCSILVLARPSGLFAEAGFPTKLGEYMACNIPVVITKVGDIPKYFTDNEHVLLAEPDNPESVAKKILYLIENPIEAEKIGVNGYQWAKNNLEYKEVVKKIVRFLKK